MVTSVFEEILTRNFGLLLPRWRTVYVKTRGHKTEFARICMAESTTFFFVIGLNIIFTPLIKIKIFKNNSLSWKIFFDFLGQFSIIHTLLRIH